MQAAVHIQNLGFSYPKQASSVINDLGLVIPKGSRYGIFGPNGAGKTTLMSLMSGLLSYNQGSVMILGHEISTNRTAVKKLIGLVPQDFSFYEELSPKENMEFFGSWYGLNADQIRIKTTELLEKVGLSNVINKPVKEFSGGMKRRVNIAIGVMNNPQVLFLDEPTVGVDVQSRHAIIDLLKEINAGGTTLIYTSHQLKEAEDLCEYAALIDQGRIIVKGSLHELKTEHAHDGLEGLFLQLTGRDYRDG